MTEKAKGGRGHKAPKETKYQIVSLSLSPDTVELLAALVQASGKSRSEFVTNMIQRHFKMWPPKRST